MLSKTISCGVDLGPLVVTVVCWMHERSRVGWREQNDGRFSDDVVWNEVKTLRNWFKVYMSSSV
eukprot:232706-Amphidinium_carterae.2